MRSFQRWIDILNLFWCPVKNSSQGKTLSPESDGYADEGEDDAEDAALRRPRRDVPVA